MYYTEEINYYYYVICCGLWLMGIVGHRGAPGCVRVK